MRLVQEPRVSPACYCAIFASCCSVAMLGSKQYAVPRVTRNCGKVGITIGLPFGIGIVNDGSVSLELKAGGTRFAISASWVSPLGNTSLKLLVFIHE